MLLNLKSRKNGVNSPWPSLVGVAIISPLTEHWRARGCMITVPSICSMMQCSLSIPGPARTVWESKRVSCVVGN